MVPIMLAGMVTVGAIALVAYLLWPTWGAEASSNPARLPVSIGGTLFNVPTLAVRMKIQRHSGPQERVDLSFAFRHLRLPTHRNTSASIPSKKRYSRSTGSSCRYRHTMTR